MPTALITGCDYGIGFEFTRQYAEDGWKVHAVCLDAASEGKLSGLSGDVRFHHVDVSDQAALATLADALKGEPIDLLINNAATFAPDGPRTLMLPDMDEFTRVMRVNAVAPIYVADAFEAHVAESTRRQMVFIGTRSGSIGDNTSGGHYAYRCSKAALNMAVKSLSIDFAANGVTTVVLHPGSVATETRKGGQIPVTESVSGMRNVIDGLTTDMSGSFLRYDGGAIEW
ncbi:MAG: SDR family oxidoreductase [Rhodospirillaceae bacterium]|jgi:NAD(P)-dependent dehydrogenase (short-subunit alcohol dehydrogenase family)|nr:SDR family oxidoreductase [Rhodospirillaceae bacterium]MBT5666112.1 SDR family oxidoreductase [Rhodospirillaceae bacterium]MBT5811224.1 SDR family oxidoreductase [Rhodospirillaceae bacterium]